MKRSLFALLFALIPLPAFAGSDWNGTWVGNWQGGDGVQIMMAGNTCTGIFWHGDYLPDDPHTDVSPDGKTLTITWDHSSAVLTRDGAQSARATITEPGHTPLTFAVKIDH